MTEGRFGPGRLALAVALVAVGFLALRPAVDSDFGWHLANGRHLADGVLLGGIDVYSWTAPGAPWVAHEWLTEAVLAALHDTLGPTAVSVALAALVAVAFAIVALRLRRRGVSRPGALATVALGFAATLVSMGVRPQLLELPYLAAALLVVDAWLDGHLPRARLWLAVGAGALLWANTHGSFLLLPATLGLTAMAALLGRERRWPEMAVAAVVAAVVPLANPWGLALYGFAGQSLTSGVTGRLVQEWQPPDLLAPSFWPFTLALGMAVLGALGAAWARATAGRRAAAAGGAVTEARLPTPLPTLPPTRWLADALVAAAVLVLALRSGRHVMLFGVAAAPLVADGWVRLGTAASRALARIRPPTPSGSSSLLSDRRSRDVVDAVVLIVVAGALALASVARVGPDAQRLATDERYPTALLPALDAAMATDPGARLFNEYTWGGFLIAARPGIPVFIDGRSEVYGDAQLERYAEIATGGPAAAGTLVALGVDLVLVKADAPLARALLAAAGGREPGGGWRELAGDGVGILLARPSFQR